MATSSKPILVLGADGKTGRRVAERLTTLGLPVRAGSRSATPSFDWSDRSTWAATLDGVGSVYISCKPELVGTEDDVEALAQLAVAKGVRRLVLLSGRGEEEAQAAEEALKTTGADWTIVRASWFNQNFSEGAFVDAVLAGEVALPVGGVREPFVDADDIADVAAAALTDDRHIGQLYELTGPRLLTFADAVAEIAQATGRGIDFVQISHKDFLAGATGSGLPNEIVELLDELFTRVLDGRNEYLTDGVQRALGRAPKDFADYARQTAVTGVWNA